jgi:hypothetical protein
MDLASRYASAVVSSNQRVQAAFNGDADLLVASGWAGARHSLAGLIHRARVEHDRGATGAAALRPALTALQSFVARQAAVMNIDLTDSAARWLTRGVTLVLLRPACPSCHGVRFDRVAGTGRLSDVACTRCGGTGKRKVNAKSQAQADLADRVLSLVEAKVQAHARRMGRYLRST